MLFQIIVLAPVIVSIDAAAAADLQDDQGRWYTSATLSLGAADVHSSSHGGSIGNGQIIDGELDGTLRHTSEIDTVAGIGFGLGWQLENWSLEGEALWRVRTDWDLAARTSSLGAVTNIQTNVSNVSVLLNGLRTFRAGQRWQWQLGAGVGVAFNQFDSDFKLRALTGVRDALELNETSRSEEFAWNLSLGVQRTLGSTLDSKWAVRLRYRFIDLGELRAGPYPGQTARVRAEHRAHELQLTLMRH